MMPISSPLLTRRASLLAGCAALATLAGCNDSGKPPEAPKPQAGKPGTEASVDVADLHKAGDLPDQILGKADAPVTIVEYASMTCGHCATFHTETMEHVKKTYVETGKVRFIFREFPLDPVAYAAALLARCAGGDKFFPMLELLFRQQRTWAFSDKPEEALLGLVRQAGFTQESFNACLQDQDAFAKLQKQRQRASASFHVDSTPTFFINGKIVRGAMTPTQFDAALKPFLDGK